MTATKLSQPGQSITITAGNLDIASSLTVDGGVAINTFAGPTRIDALSGLTFINRLDAAEVYRDIRDGGLAGMSIEDIAEKVRERLVDIAAQHRGRPGQAERVALLDSNLDRVEPLALGGLLDRTADRPATFAELRGAYAADIARARTHLN